MTDASKRFLTVEIPTTVHQELKVTAARRQVSMRELVQTAIESMVLDTTAGNGPSRRHEDR